MHLPLENRVHPRNNCYQEAILNSVLLCLVLLPKLFQVLSGCSCRLWHHFLANVSVLLCPSVSVPKKHTEVYINYKLVGLVAQASY